MEDLKNFISDNMLEMSFGEFEGIRSLTLAELYQLGSLVNLAIKEYEHNKI